MVGKLSGIALHNVPSRLLPDGNEEKLANHIQDDRSRSVKFVTLPPAREDLNYLSMKFCAEHIVVMLSH